jgi:hypothetical protein
MPVARAGEAAAVDAAYGSRSRSGFAQRNVHAPARMADQGSGSIIRVRTRMTCDGFVRSVDPLVAVVAGLELAGVRLGEDLNAFRHFTGATAYQWRATSRKAATNACWLDTDPPIRGVQPTDRDP